MDGITSIKFLDDMDENENALKKEIESYLSLLNEYLPDNPHVSAMEDKTNRLLELSEEADIYAKWMREMADKFERLAGIFEWNARTSRIFLRLLYRLPSDEES